MDSRMEKYKDIDIEEFQRSKKNANLYKEVYGKYSDFEDLPIPTNTNEIDLENLRSLVGSRNDRKKENVMNQDYADEDSLEFSKEEKIYDINTLLEKAKEENAKIKKDNLINKNVPNYLANLESDINTKDIILNYDGNEDDDVPIVNAVSSRTSELKLDNSSLNTSELSLDILSDLKPNGDTFVSEPVLDKENIEEEKDFFDNKTNFSNEDFESDDEDESLEESNHLFIKILCIVIGVSTIITALYFVLKEYINIF